VAPQPHVHRRGRRGDLEHRRKWGLRRGALAGSLGGKPVLAARLEVGQTESAPDALVEQRRRRRVGGDNGHRRSDGTALAWWRSRLLLRGGDIRAAVGAPGAPCPVRHASVAFRPSLHERAAEQASTEAVLRL
jgi:hypothetical protein